MVVAHNATSAAFDVKCDDGRQLSKGHSYCFGPLRPNPASDAQ